MQSSLINIFCLLSLVFNLLYLIFNLFSLHDNCSKALSLFSFIKLSKNKLQPTRCLPKITCPSLVFNKSLIQTWSFTKYVHQILILKSFSHFEALIKIVSIISSHHHFPCHHRHATTLVSTSTQTLTKRIKKKIYSYFRSIY